MRDVFLETLLRILEPIVRFAVRRSLKIQSFEESVKRLYFRIAQEEIAHLGGVVTTSKLSAMTGLQRKDLKRLAGEPLHVERSKDLLTRIIGLWQADRRFRTGRGDPRILSLGRSGEFAELVTQVSTDLNPYTILFELERAGAVRCGEKGVELVRPAYEPRGNTKEALGLLAADVRDLCEAVDENIFAPANELNLHIKTEYDNIPASKLPLIRGWFLREGADFHARARKFLSRFDRDLNPDLKDDGDGSRVRAMIGTFSLTEEADGSEKNAGKTARRNAAKRLGK